MGQTVTAVYENGVLRPLQPLALPEHARVEIDVRTIGADDPETLRARVHDVLADAGLLTPPVASSTGSLPLSAEERARLAQRLADAGVPPLSEAILDEREGR
jgi:predicted DNA-binding antitoxin AbrB/MazE fold protein